MAGPVEWCSPDNHTCNFMSHPLIKSICWNETALRFKRLPERGSCGHRLRPPIDGLVSNGRIFGPRRNESPSHHRELPGGLVGILADCQNRLRGGDVVAGTPLVLVGDCAEILLDKLLSPRQSVSPAHQSHYRKLSADSACTEDGPETASAFANVSVEIRSWPRSWCKRPVGVEKVRDRNVRLAAVIAAIEFFLSPQLIASFHSRCCRLAEEPH